MVRWGLLGPQKEEAQTSYSYPARGSYPDRHTIQAAHDTPLDWCLGIGHMNMPLVGDARRHSTVPIVVLPKILWVPYVTVRMCVDRKYKDVTRVNSVPICVICLIFGGSWLVIASSKACKYLSLMWCWCGCGYHDVRFWFLFCAFLRGTLWGTVNRYLIISALLLLH